MDFNYKKYLLLSVLMWWLLFSIKAKSQSSDCYTAFQVCYSAPHSNGLPAGFSMMFLDVQPQLGDILYLYSESNPGSSGYYLVDATNLTGQWFHFASAPCGYYDVVIFPDGTILTLNPQGTGVDCWCVATNGGDECPLPPGFEMPIPFNMDCEEWLEACGEGIVNDLILRDLTIDGCEQWVGDCGPSSTIYRYGSVGIGTATEPSPNPFSGGHKLYVNGGIVTEQLKLIGGNSIEWGSIDHHGKTRSWCDYVFEKGYPLMPLDNVEAYIHEKKHLPKTPSAKELEEMGGFELGSVLVNHQEKIEEVFLHLFDIKGQISEMEEALLNVKK